MSTYIGYDGNSCSTRLSRIRDYLAINFSLDYRDIPYNENNYGIIKNLNLNTNEDLRSKITSMVNKILGNSIVSGVSLDSVNILANKVLIKLSMPDGTQSLLQL